MPDSFLTAATPGEAMLSRQILRRTVAGILISFLIITVSSCRDTAQEGSGPKIVGTDRNSAFACYRFYEAMTAFEGGQDDYDELRAKVESLNMRYGDKALDERVKSAAGVLAQVFESEKGNDGDKSLSIDQQDASERLRAVCDALDL